MPKYNNASAKTIMEMPPTTSKNVVTPELITGDSGKFARPKPANIAATYSKAR